MDLPDWSSGVGKHLLKVEEGKAAVGNIRGKLERFYQHWQGGRSSICPGRDTCSLCQSTDDSVRKASGKFRVNFVMRENPADKGSPLVARIFEGGKRVYDQLLQLNQDLPLEKAWLKISRSGKGKDTQYMLSYLVGENAVVTPAQEKDIVKVPLHDLSVSKPEEETSDANEEAPF
jgi:hypothetical protein